MFDGCVHIRDCTEAYRPSCLTDRRQQSHLRWKTVRRSVCRKFCNFFTFVWLLKLTHFFLHQDTTNASRCRKRRKEVCSVQRIRKTTKQTLKQKQQQPRPKQKRSLCDISMRVRVVLCGGWWLCFSACNLKKYCVVRCLLYLLIDIDTDVKIEEETE